MKLLYRIINMRFYLLLILLLSKLVSTNAQEISAIERVISPNPLQQYFLIFPPFWQKNDDDSFSGLHYRLAKRLYQHAGLDVDFINVPYKRMQLKAAQGAATFINYGEVKGVKTEDVVYVCVPPTEITLRVYYLKDNLPEITTVEGFKDQRIIIIHGLPLGNYEQIKTDETISLMHTNTIKSSIKGLQLNRGDYLIVFENLMINAQKRFLFGTNDVLKSYPLFTLFGYPVTTPKSYPEGKNLCDKVLKSYHQLVEEGVIDAQNKILVSDLENNL